MAVQLAACRRRGESTHGHDCRYGGARWRAPRGRLAGNRQEAHRARRHASRCRRAPARVRASPTTLLKAQGATIAAERRRGARAAPTSCSRCAGLARRGEGPQARRHRRRHAGALRRPAGPRCAGRHRRVADGHGVHAAHLARAVHGRAVEPGQPRRLQGGDRCRRPCSARPCR